jgi:hypothetical protein
VILLDNDMLKKSRRVRIIRYARRSGRERIIDEMLHDEFRVGETFRCGGKCWRCTDIGERTIAAICLDGVQVTDGRKDRTLSQAEAEAEGWFNGPPYAVAEEVFDEDDMPGCDTLTCWRSDFR